MTIDHLCASVLGSRSGLGTLAACHAVALPRATFYRRQKPRQIAKPPASAPCRVPGRALSLEEQQCVIAELHSERFVDKAPPQVYAILLDGGDYLCSISTMYRLLRKCGEAVERRRLRTHAPATRPELLATGPNQVWSWDITKLKAPQKWSYYFLYVIIDVFSRCVVGWSIAERENALIAEALIQNALFREGVKPGTLTIHADRGSAMTSATVADLLIDLGVAKSHSRPHTSNDNPFSESHFKTMKYRPQMPARFGSVQEARDLFRELFHWYNNDHRHSALALLSPATVHSGRAQEVTRGRARVLDHAFASHPARFLNQPPRPIRLPEAVWINPPVILPEASRDVSGGSIAATA